MKLILIPSEQGSLEKNLGCKEAPQAILRKINFPAEQVDYVEVKPSDVEETDERIYAKAKEIFSRKEQAVFLGGDHSITYSLFKAFSESFGASNSSLVVFDAHADATAFFKPVSHEDMNKVLVEENLLLPENLLLIGTRRIWKEEREFLRKYKIKILKGNESGELDQFLKKSKNLYLSIDIDCFDQGAAPGTGYGEKNGLQEKEFFALLQAILRSGKVFGADLCEVNPRLDENERTVTLAGRILKGILRFS